MAQSRISSSLKYPEPQTQVAPADKLAKLRVYKLSVHGADRFVAIGAHTSDREHRVVHFPVYLLDDTSHKARCQIGVYELMSADLQRVLDEESRLGELDLLLFSSATPEYMDNVAAAADDAPLKTTKKKKTLAPPLAPPLAPLAAPPLAPLAAAADPAADPALAAPPAKKKKKAVEPVAAVEPVVAAAEEPKKSKKRAAAAATVDEPPPKVSRHTIFGSSSAPVPPPAASAAAALAKERRAARKERERYVPSDDDNWLCKYMRSKRYAVHTVAGRGDCFFESLQRAFAGASPPRVTSIADLRALLAQEATQEVFETARELYAAAAGSAAESRKAGKAKEAEYRALGEQLAALKDKAERVALRERIAQVKLQHERLRREHADSLAMAVEMGHMREVHSLEEFRALVKKPQQFWADAWAVHALERALRIKCIILKRPEAAEAADLDGPDNVVQCSADFSSDADDDDKPEHYVLLDYDGHHYNMVAHDEVTLFAFAQLPVDLRMMVVRKCLEWAASGSFGKIADFRQMQQLLGAAPVDGGRVAHFELTGNDHQDVVGGGGGGGALEELDTVQALREEEEEGGRAEGGRAEAGLFDESAGLFRVSASAEDAPPGEWTGEKKPRDGGPGAAPPRHWRRKLDDSWRAPFTVPADRDGLRWNSVTHYVAARPMRSAFPKVYRALSMDSGTPLSRDPAAARESVAPGKGRRPPGIYREFFESAGGAQVAHRSAALAAKFAQNADLHTALAATGRAHLVYARAGKKPLSDAVLMSKR